MGIPAGVEDQVPTNISKTYVTEDGHVFLSLADAEKHDDVLRLFHRIQDEVGRINHINDVMSLAEWLVDNFEMTPKNQSPAQD